jgi:glycosyltransferase involved in cell wall biosynthesis
MKEKKSLYNMKKDIIPDEDFDKIADEIQKLQATVGSVDSRLSDLSNMLSSLKQSLGPFNNQVVEREKRIGVLERNYVSVEQMNNFLHSFNQLLSALKTEQINKEQKIAELEDKLIKKEQDDILFHQKIIDLENYIQRFDNKVPKIVWKLLKNKHVMFKDIVAGTENTIKPANNTATELTGGNSAIEEVGEVEYLNIPEETFETPSQLVLDYIEPQIDLPSQDLPYSPDDYHYLSNSEIDWASFICDNNLPDSVDPIEYYLTNYLSGKINTDNFFDSVSYLNCYPDIVQANLNPLVHYLQFGKVEGRLNLTDCFYEGKLDYDPNKKTFVIVCHESSATGAPLVGLNLAMQLEKRYNIVNIVLTTRELNDSFVDHSVLLVSGTGACDPRTYKNIFDKINDKYSIDAIICNSVCTYHCLEVANQLLYPTVFLLHEFHEYSFQSAVAKSIIAADKVIVPSTIIKESAENELKETFYSDSTNNIEIRPQGKLIYIPESYGGSLNADELRKRLKIKNPQTKIIVGAGYVQIRKGVDYFIEVARRVKRKYKGDVKFLWVGDGYTPKIDIFYSVWLANQLKSSEIMDDFVFLEHQKNLSAILEIADCFLLTSRLDPFPNVAIDAFSADVFVSCFEKTTGIAEFMTQHKLNGNVVPFLDFEKMSQGVVDHFELSKAELEKRKGINSSAVEKYLDFDKYTSFIEEQILQATELVNERKAIEKKIEESGYFDENYAVYSNCVVGNSITYYTNMSLKSVHTLNPRPGFSNAKWLLDNKYEDKHKVPLCESLAETPNGQPPKTHDCVVLSGSDDVPDMNIAIHIHLYYPDLSATFVNYINNIPIDFDLYLTICNDDMTDMIREVFSLPNVKKLEIIEVENIGRNFAPLFISLKNRIYKNNYDVVGHFHSKKSADNTDGIGNRWRDYLLDNLIGETEFFNETINLFKDSENGLIFADDTHSVGLLKNKPYASDLCKTLNIKLPEDVFVFPLGSMFWARPEALAPLFELDFEKFIEPEPLQFDGSYMHAIERLIPVVAESKGYKYKTVYKKGTSW